MKKIILLLISYVLSLFSSFSQEIEWQNTIGGNSDDVLNSIAQTSDGGYICGGYSSSFISGDKTENSLGADDYWIVKLDVSGNIQWQNTIGGSGYDRLFSVKETSDGGFICGGNSLSFISGDKTETNIGLDDYWIIKLDVSGNIQWQNTIGGTDQDYLRSIEQTADGGYICGGYSISDSSGDKTENCLGLGDYWVVKLDASGILQWENTIGGSDGDQLYSIEQTADGGYICGGWSASPISGDKTENSVGTRDYWVVKLDAAGSIQWQNDIGGISTDDLYSISQTADGGYICGGSSASPISGDKTENWIGSPDYWILKLDASGNIQWQNTIGGTNLNFLYSISQTADGGYICGGYSVSGFSGDKTEGNYGNFDHWVIKLDATGNIEWQNTIGGNGNDELQSIIPTADGGYIFGGRSISNQSGDKNENNSGGYDYWVVKLTDKYNLITGKLFYDVNSNNVHDIGEAAVINHQVSESTSGRLTFSQNTGDYYLGVIDSGNFSVYAAPANYYAPVPLTHTAYFPGIQQTDSLNDFAFQPAGVFNDLCLTISPLGAFRAGMNANYMINYENVGTTTLNGTVIFFPDNDVTFVSSNVIPTSVTTDSVVWNVGTLTPFQTGSILVTVNVNLGTANGTLINSMVRIEPVAGDNYPGCNYDSWEVFVTGAVDPNAILVDRDSVLTTELSSPPYLNYIIYFQNTGNDTAFNVRVLDNIPQTLDVNSFEFVASSHPMNITYGAHSRLFTFTFDNILLPDSNVNEPASHGFIRYKIKPLSTLVVGDSIKNNAAIYFDFNQPVLTDTAVTEIVLPTGEEELKVKSLKLKVFPNPSNDVITISASQLSTDNCQLTIFDLYGRVVLKSEIVNPKSEIKINVSRFSQGIYFVEMQSGEQVLRGKFLKE